MAEKPLQDLLRAASDLQGEIYEPGEVRLTNEGGNIAALKELIEARLPEELANHSELKIKGSIGIGKVSNCPWVGLFPADSKGAATDGYYIVYLFAADGSHIYLSLNQAVMSLQRGASKALQKRALDIRSIVGSQSDLDTNIDLKSTGGLPRLYQAGNAYAYPYRADEVPSDDELLDHLERMSTLLGTVVDSGLEFDPTHEPIHLLFKWATEYEPATIKKHQAVADSKGSVWWGKFGRSDRAAMSAKNISEIRDQLDEEIPTYAYLYRAGETWKTTVLDVTADPTMVDTDLLPSYYEPDDCNLFVRLTDFEELESDWPTSNLLLASNPDPDKLSSALSNQTSPLRMFKTYLAENDAPSPTATTEDLTIDWLAAKTLWNKESLQELIHALESDSAQIVLAGPPGTGKTWVAKHLARYLTQDRPLAHRIVQFHPSFGYEEFIEGLRPVVEKGGIQFKRVDGVVLRMVEKVQDDDQLHVLVIDEMNRANLSSVFGELMYLFEYREEPVDLQYSEDFRLPENLRFIGTMNTADRSIRSIDIALRRRFDVFECPPDPNILASYYEIHNNQVPGLIEGFQQLNQDLESRLDRHHTIGHTFFMAKEMSPRRLTNTWQRKIRPLIEEYFFDQPDEAEQFKHTKYWPSLQQ